MGLTPKEFYQFTMQEFAWKMEGYRSAKMERWHHTRALAFVIAKPHLKNQNMTIERFWPMATDEKTGINALSAADRRSAVKKLKQDYLRAAKQSNN